MSDFDNDGFSSCQGDCDNYDRWTHQNAVEELNDEIDQSCDGMDLEAKVVASENATCAIDIFGDVQCWGTGDIIGNEPGRWDLCRCRPQNSTYKRVINKFCQLSCWGVGNNDLCGAENFNDRKHHRQLTVFGDQLCTLRSNGQMACEGCATTGGSAGLTAMDILQISGGNNGYACGLTAEHTVSCLSSEPLSFQDFAEDLTQISIYNHRICESEFRWKYCV